MLRASFPGRSAAPSARLRASSTRYGSCEAVRCRAGAVPNTAFRTVPVQRSSAEEALHRARETEAALSRLSFTFAPTARPRRPGAGLAVGLGEPGFAQPLARAGGFAVASEPAGSG